MPRNSFLSGRQASQVVWIIVSSIFALGSLFIVFETAEASSSPVASKNQALLFAVQITDTLTSTLQVDVSPAPDAAFTVLPGITPTIPSEQIGSSATYSFSLATLDYEETILQSPQGNARYTFRIPENWVIRTDGVLDLDLSYVYNQVDRANDYPAFFGDLTVKYNDQILEIFPIDESELDHYQLRVAIPSSVLTDKDRFQHVIEFSLDAGLICEIPHKATLIVHPRSSVFLNYSPSPLVPDLSRYPWPFYQRAFEPDRVRFVLPAQPTTVDAASAVAMAAKLGDLTRDQLVISATTDVDLVPSVSSPLSNFDEHLIIIGQPQHNQLLPLLNDATELPVSLHQQQLALSTQGPSAIAPGDIFTYTFTITNTIDRPINLSVVNPLPAYTEFIDCTGCSEDTITNTVTWPGNQLEPDDTLSLALTLRASDFITGSLLENTATLIEAEIGPASADTFVSAIVTDSIVSEMQISAVNQGDYFFTYGGQAAAKEDGIIQEILSPWSENRAILVVTGLSDEAVREAAQAMSSEVRFPGMRGVASLVREALSSSEIDETRLAAVDMTFEELGYDDQVVRGGNQHVEYNFEIPYGWQLTEEAFIELDFSHSQLIDYENSGLNVSLNNQPLVSIPLSEETAGNGRIRADLAVSRIHAARNNRLNVQPTLSLPGKCRQEEELVWFISKNTSKLSLVHNEDTGLGLNLADFPAPFHTNQALSDLLFALPAAPTIGEWGIVLRLAASLGSAAAGKTIAPAVMMGDNLSENDLANYHIIAVGRPSRNELIQQVNNYLPQSFVPGSDVFEQRFDDVVLRLLPDVDLGYDQLLPSPWNEERAIAVVTGSSDKGVEWAADTLARPWTLKGNLALVRDKEVSAIDTRELIAEGAARAVATVVPEMTVVPGMVATATTISTTQPLSDSTVDIAEAESTATDSRNQQPTWLIPLVTGNGAIVLGIFVFVFWRARRKKF